MNICVFYGGKSCEHNISVITGVQTLNALEGHRVIPVYIRPDGVWFSGKNYGDVSVYKKPVKGEEVFIKPYSDCLYNRKGKKICTVDCAVLCNHGLNGEDGSLQGLLQLSGIPFTGSGVLASAVGMDKHIMKMVFKAAGLPIIKYRHLKYADYIKDKEGAAGELIKSLKLPIIIKPDNLGSSIGISVAHDKEQLIAALDVAFEWDYGVTAEKALTDFTELNCAVLGSGGDAEIVSEVEKPLSWSEFLTYEDKYGGGKGFKGGGGRQIPADISEEMTEKIKKLAAAAFGAIGGGGAARIDFLLDNTLGKIFINEINTIPGSLSNYLFSYGGGLSFSQLLERMIVIAKAEKEQRDSRKYCYKSYFESGSKLK